MSEITIIKDLAMGIKSLKIVEKANVGNDFYFEA